MRALLIVFLFGLFQSICYPQNTVSITDIRNVYDEKGDYYFDKKDFKKAIVYYNMAYRHDANNYYSVLRKAEAFATLELYDQAAACYGIIFATELHITNDYRLEYALLLLKNKDITGFEKWMGIYNEIVRSEIHDYLTSTEVRAKMYKDTSFIIVENESVLNTPESEICPVVYHDKVLFASTRKNLEGSAANAWYNMYSANYLDDGHLGKLNVFNTSLNSAQNESSLAFSDKTNSMYFTRSTSVGSKLKSYVANIPATMNVKLDIREFSPEGFGSIGQISLNSSGTKMYFVSNAPGGSGGLDIYSSDLVGGKWSKPKNLGTSINSSKDEMYPFILNDSILYFSSAGHNGMGGLDLYSVNLKRENSAPKNLGSKVNSEYDDYALTFSSGGLTGYFCSNRPGGLGKEDIYRVHLLDIKVKLPAYKFKKKPFIEDHKINLYLSNGSEYNITSKDQSGFDFGFLPGEAYKMIIQHENPLASDIIYNTKLTEDQRRKELLNPPPIQKTDIKLQTGMKYQFTVGMKPISAGYKNALNEISKGYQNPNNSTIDLTALAKEMLMTEGEIYTIRFVKDDNQYSENKVKAASGLFINDKIIPVSGESFFIVLPLDLVVNFNILTDIAYLKENFSPKKVGTVKIDAGPVYKEEPVKLSEGFPILVNTESFNDASQKKISAKELTIIPGIMYILTFGKPDAGPQDEIVVPLTKGVKYNLGTETLSENEYNKALTQMTAGQAGSSIPNEELIDISVLSKELDILSDKDIVFSLTPAKQFASQTAEARNILTTISVDGRKYFITNRVKMQVNLKLEQNKKVNIQTDLAYIQENYEPATIAIKVDTTSFNRNLQEKKKAIITDPVFDVIVINFNLNDYSIHPEAKSILADKVVQVLKGDSRLYVTIKGYTDPLGDEVYNEKLSRNRAQAVKDFLTNNGIGENRIRTFSYGESLAIKDGVRWEDLSEAELQKYRKVEIVMYLPK
jgi:outer membrane protein OmpA-like peptidoglycan-associated protein